jgi:hypothetical protein
MPQPSNHQHCQAVCAQTCCSEQLLADGEQALWPEDHQHDQRHAEEQVLQVAEIHPEQMHPE